MTTVPLGRAVEGIGTVVLDGADVMTGMVAVEMRVEEAGMTGDEAGAGVRTDEEV